VCKRKPSTIIYYSMKIILATRNPSKAEQIREVFAGSIFNVITLKDADIEGDIVEDGGSLLNNSRIKARFAHSHAQGKCWSMSDDTGVFITGLGGEPGVEAAYWGGNLSDTERMNYCLERMKDLTDRTGFFETVVVLISPEGTEYSFSGKAEGVFLEAPRYNPQKGMPYSGIFRPYGTEKVWAEMNVQEENAISHRGKAFRLARAFLEGSLEK
jgi:XTP/dITP diphosphohydrolase